MDIVKFNRVWEINTKEDYDAAMKSLDGSDFIARMTDEWAKEQEERAEVRRQRAQVMEQAKAKGII